MAVPVFPDQVLTGADGQPVPIVVTGTVLHDEDGNQTGVFASVQDVSGVRRAASGRERQEKLFLSLAQRAGDLSMVTDATGLVLYIAPALTEHVGWKVEAWSSSPPPTRSTPRTSRSSWTRSSGSSARASARP